MTRPSRAVCVFCGSRNGARDAYRENAAAVGAMIARNGWRLVFGAGDVGLMGEVARAAQAAGAQTFGVIPAHLVGKERPSVSLGTQVVTETMHERKKVMFMNSDAIVVLPGGAGSLDEFFEVLTWRQLGLHDKPILLLNTNGYWDPLGALIDNVIAEEFAAASLRDYFVLVDDVAGLEASLRAALP